MSTVPGNPPSLLSIYKSIKHFGISFAYDTPKIWNDLPDMMYTQPNFSLFIHTEVENLSLCKGISTLVVWSCLYLSLWH